MGQVYIEAIFDGTSVVKVELETLLVIYIYHICDTNTVKLNVVPRGCLKGPLFAIDLFGVNHEVVNDVPDLVHCCVWPVITTGNVVIAGLCSVSRQIIKSSDNKELHYLLGFKESCLLACSESSVWTKFCEVEVPTAIKEVFINIDHYVESGTLRIPLVLTQFEHHMQQPVRMHNVYKMAREHHHDKTIKSSVPMEKLNLSHHYIQGPFMTLADVLLFPCFHILFQICESIESVLPLSAAWFKKMRSSDLRLIQFELPRMKKMAENCRVISDTLVTNETLYLLGPSKYKPQNRVYTKQIDVDNSINIIDKLNFEITNGFEPFGSEVEFDWDEVPLPANPIGGALPEKRANRKCEQLENLARAVIKLVGGREGYTIVDFCSGSGHLGILLGTLLPSCKIILVENKERSLLRAYERISQLALKNITLLQCNLDYFCAKFDVGVSLHACGVATDLVIQNCIKNRAHFVCCPCCYGSIHDCYHMKYPRSKEFLESNMSYKEYLNIAHAADQTHDSDNVKTKQGYICMDIIDTDRKLQAESCDYIVHLGKLQPTSCTPKNNLLVGVCNSN